jgi:hypothetical protein
LAEKQQTATLANGVTCVRAVLITSILALAAVWASREMLLLALVASWATDALDGFAARHFRCESILGAQLDYNVDRLVATAAIVAAAMISRGDPLVLVASATVWLQYGAFDQLICCQFLRCDALWSPDDFWTIDEMTWRLNWSPAAKLAGHVPLALLAVGGYGLVPSIVLATLLIVIRTTSYYRAADGITAAIDALRIDPLSNAEFLDPTADPCTQA